MTKIVGYLRVSTEDQAREGVSLAAQRWRIGQWCEGQGHAPEALAYFTDAGISGKRADNRPGLKSALDAVCVPGGILVVYSLSRMARSIQDTLAIAERLAEAGADLVSLSESLETVSATGKMLFRLLAVLAEFERDLLSERTKSAMSVKRSRGERLGKVPYGTKLGADGKTLEIEPAEFTQIGLMLTARKFGASIARITREMNERGVPSRSGRPWARSTVAYLIGHRLRETP